MSQDSVYSFGSRNANPVLHCKTTREKIIIIDETCNVMPVASLKDNKTTTSIRTTFAVVRPILYH